MTTDHDLLKHLRVFASPVDGGVYERPPTRLYEQAIAELERLYAEVEWLERATIRERLGTASALRDIECRIGPAASPEWVRAELERVANRLEFWAQPTPPFPSAITPTQYQKRSR